MISDGISINLKHNWILAVLGLVAIGVLFGTNDVYAKLAAITAGVLCFLLIVFLAMLICIENDTVEVIGGYGTIATWIAIDLYYAILIAYASCCLIEHFFIR